MTERWWHEFTFVGPKDPDPLMDAPRGFKCEGGISVPDSDYEGSAVRMERLEAGLTVARKWFREIDDDHHGCTQAQDALAELDRVAQGSESDADSG